MTDAYERAKADDEAWEREHDSREKLEAEVYNHIAISITPNEENDGVLAPYATVLEWLDRQAAITQADTMARYREELKRRTKRESKLQSKVDELQAERDKANESGGKLFDALIDMTAERDKLQAQLDAYDQTHMERSVEMDKTAAQEYNLDVQVVAEPKIEYTVELRRRRGATTSMSAVFHLE